MLKIEIAKKLHINKINSKKDLVLIYYKLVYYIKNLF